MRTSWVIFIEQNLGPHIEQKWATLAESLGSVSSWYSRAVSGSRPRLKEIAEEMGIDVEKVRDVRKIAQEPVSLETPIGEEEDSHLGDFIEDDSAIAPDDAANFTMLREQLNSVLGTLNDRERKVLELRFGLTDGTPRTLEEVGKEFNVTRERIRQIEAKALRKLKHPTRSSKLKDFLE